MADISIVICTYNRAESLRDTLQSIAAQSMSGKRAHEIIVVDNNSSDHTRSVAESFPQVRYVFEGRQGVAFARNRGVEEAKGGIVAFLDDDVIADPGWLRGIWRAFNETGADAVGGRILRRWDCEKPEWYSEELGGCLISQDLGDERRKWKHERRHMVTANMAFRRDVFQRFGRFREELGRRAESLLGGEDRELYKRLVQQGGLVIYEPSALVFHKVESHRLSKDYMRRWFYEIGQTLGYEMTPRLFVAPLWVWGGFLKSLVRKAAAHLFLRGEKEKFAAEVFVRYHAGMIRELFWHWVPRRMGQKFSAFGRRHAARQGAAIK